MTGSVWIAYLVEFAHGTTARGLRHVAVVVPREAIHQFARRAL